MTDLHSGTLGTRRALVVAVDDYESTERCPDEFQGREFGNLERVPHDAVRMREEVEALAFRAETLRNPTAERLHREISSFVKDAVKLQQQQEGQAQQVLMLFFSGHGVCIRRKQYVVSSDCRPINVYKEFVAELDKKLRDSVIILVIDACGESFECLAEAAHEEEAGPSTCQQPVRTPKLIRSPDERNGNIIACAYACQEGQQAFEGKLYGAWTAALVKHMSINHDIETILRRAQGELKGMQQWPIVEVWPRKDRRRRFTLCRTVAPPVEVHGGSTALQVEPNLTTVVLHPDVPNQATVVDSRIVRTDTGEAMCMTQVTVVFTAEGPKCRRKRVVRHTGDTIDGCDLHATMAGSESSAELTELPISRTEVHASRQASGWHQKGLDRVETSICIDAGSFTKVHTQTDTTLARADVSEPQAELDEEQEALLKWVSGLAEAREVLLERFALTRGHMHKGGQGCVQMAVLKEQLPGSCGTPEGHPLGLLKSRASVAIKFFYNRADFDTEAAAFRCTEIEEARILPRAYDLRRCGTVEEWQVGTAGSRVQATPLIVMDAGITLKDSWAAARNLSSYATDFRPIQVVRSIAALLATFHALGYVHRDIKPGNLINVSHCSSLRDWRLIDLATHATTGSEVAPAFTLNYAAPEAVVYAHQPHSRRHLRSRLMAACPSLDIWSLGVIALELFTNESALPLHNSSRLSPIRAAFGRSPYPWEAAVGVFREELGILDSLPLDLREVLVLCLSRRPESRPSADTVVATLDRIMTVDNGTHSSRLMMSCDVTDSLPVHASEPPMPSPPGASNYEIIEEITDVATLFQQLSGQLKGMTVWLNNRTIAPTHGPPSGSGSSPWDSVDLWPHMDTICWSNVRTGLFSLRPGSAQPRLFCGMSGRGTRVACGTLQLSDKTCVVLDETCSDVQFRNLVIQGGLIVCYGRGCKVTFYDVTFESCCLVAVAGAHADIDCCNFSQSTTSCEGISVIAHGYGTTVRMFSSAITGGAQGAAAHQGAQFLATAVTFRTISVTGVESRDEGSVLTLSGCTIKDMPTDESLLETDIRGLFVHAGSKADLKNVKVRNTEWGLFVCDRGKASVTDCEFSGTNKCCVSFRSAAVGRMLLCCMSSSLTHGLEVSGQDSKVEAQSCKFLRNQQGGAAAFSGANLVLNSCECSRNEAAGLWAQNSAYITANKCKSFCDKNGLGAHANSKVVAEQLSVRESTGDGLLIKGKSNCELTSCTVENAGENGIRVVGSGSKAVMTSSKLKGCKMNAIRVINEGEATLQQCEIKEVRKHDGVSVEGDNTNLQAEGCQLLDCAENGIAARQGGSIQLAQCGSRGNGGAGYAAEEGGVVRLTECHSDRDMDGCCATSGGLVVARKVAVRDSKRSGFMCSQKGSAELNDCQVYRSGEAGVWAMHSGSSCAMLDCVVRQPQQSCVMVEAGASAQLAGCELADSQQKSGLSAAGSLTRVEMDNCKLVGNSECGICATNAAELTLRACQSARNQLHGFRVLGKCRLELSRCVSEGGFMGVSATGPAQVRMDDVRVQRGRGVGFLMAEGAHCSMRQCSASGFGTNGIEVCDQQTVVSVEGGRLEGCGECGAVVRNGGCLSMHDVRSADNTTAGFKCKQAGGKLELVRCLSEDKTPYVAAVFGGISCDGCSPCGPGQRRVPGSFRLARNVLARAHEQSASDR